MNNFTSFRIFQAPLEAEELIDILQKNNIPFERCYEKTTNPEDYVGSNPFDVNIVIKINKENFSRSEFAIKEFKKSS